MFVQVKCNLTDRHGIWHCFATSCHFSMFYHEGIQRFVPFCQMFQGFDHVTSCQACLVQLHLEQVRRSRPVRDETVMKHGQVGGVISDIFENNVQQMLTQKTLAFHIFHLLSVNTHDSTLFIYTKTNTHTHMYINVNICICIIFICICICKYTHVYTNINKSCVCIYIYINIYIYT